MGEEAADKARRSAGAIDLEPGEYPVVLEEYAVATVLEYLSWMGFSALAVELSRIQRSGGSASSLPSKSGASMSAAGQS